MTKQYYILESKPKDVDCLWVCNSKGGRWLRPIKIDDIVVIFMERGYPFGKKESPFGPEGIWIDKNHFDEQEIQWIRECISYNIYEKLNESQKAKTSKQ